MKISYNKDTRDLAAAKGYGMFTIEYNGDGFPKGSASWRARMTMQGPMSHEDARLILEFVEKLKAVREARAAIAKATP